MTTANELIFDAWSPLSFKRALGGRKQPGYSWAAPNWVGDHDRRLLAYKILQAYQDNAARVFMGTTDQIVIDQHREYGDAALMVNQIVSALIGEGQDVVVDGAEDYHEADGENQEDPDALAAHNLQEWLRKWADAERLPLKMIETERNSVGLGDGVYVLGWNANKRRARLRVFDPGFYFPVLSDGNEDDFPEKVHIAWEVPNTGSQTRTIRRITWELGPISPASTPGLIGKLTGQELVPLDGDEVDADGGITRSLPWNEEPTGITCYMTDAVWELDSGNASVDDFTGAKATFLKDSEGEINRRDLMIDFIPVVHVPNTVAIANHYGRSSISTVLQILDDLSNADTDLQAASATTGKPVIALSGATMGNSRPTYRAGEVFEIGDGSMTVMDTSKSLDALIRYVEFLLARVSVNARLPESVLGRVKPSQVPSGVALALSFGPLASMVAEMRLVRNEKYPLLLKFVHRMAVAGQAPDVPTDFLPATVEFGSFLPQDQSAAVLLVTQLLTGKAIGLETAVKILQSAGLPIEDATAEVQRIQERDFTGADELLTATGDEDAVFEYLNRTKPDRPLRPVVPAEPVKGGPPPLAAPPTPPAPGAPA